MMRRQALKCRAKGAFDDRENPPYLCRPVEKALRITRMQFRAGRMHISLIKSKFGIACPRKITPLFHQQF